MELVNHYDKAAKKQTKEVENLSKEYGIDYPDTKQAIKVRE